MNVPLITMKPELAREKLRAFRSDRHKDAEVVYRQTANAYEALARGTPLISLTAAIQAGGLHGDWRPKLAIARADRPEVRFQWRHNTKAAEFCSGATPNQTVSRTETLLRNVDMGRNHNSRYPDKTDGSKGDFRWVSGYALVPMVPADVRPKIGMLKDWFVLWEVDRWYDQPKHMKAPIDPFLLQHVGGDLYAVLAQWDLTDVERLVLEGAMGS